jgi:allantoinase
LDWRHHGRYGYSPIVDRPLYAWPGGQRLAVYIAVNVETFPFGQDLGSKLNARQPEPDVVNHGWRDWGNRGACGTCCRRWTKVVGHGRTNTERAADMTPEAEMIEACTARIASEEGAAPKGWMGPWVH